MIDIDIEKFEALKKLTKLTPTDKILLINLCEKYKLQGCNICMSCDDQVRYLYTKVMNYYDKCSI